MLRLCNHQQIHETKNLNENINELWVVVLKRDNSMGCLNSNKHEINTYIKLTPAGSHNKLMSLSKFLFNVFADGYMVT